MRYTKIPVSTFEEIQLNAGIIVDSFDPVSGEYGNIIGATSGGVNFSAVPSFTDFGEDIDNCPKNMMELKKLDAWDIKMSGSYVTVKADSIRRMLGAADVSGEKITPRRDLLLTDFQSVWFVGDYSANNGDSNGGFIAIKVMNALSTGGFSIQSTDKQKSKFSFEYTGHVSMAAQDVVPCEIYVREGTEEPETYTVTYNSNGGTGTVTDANSPYQPGSTVTVKTNSFTKTGKTFGAWNTLPDGNGTEYQPNATFAINRNMTLYAIWENEE